MFLKNTSRDQLLQKAYCIREWTRTKVVSQKVLNGLNRKYHFRKVIQSAGQLNTCFPFVRTFGPKIPVQMFAYLISKLLCNIYQSLDVRSKKSASLERTKTSFGSRETMKETYLESILKVPGRELSSVCLSWFFLRKSVLSFPWVISLHDWFTSGALAADKHIC